MTLLFVFIGKVEITDDDLDELTVDRMEVDFDVGSLFSI